MSFIPSRYQVAVQQEFLHGSGDLLVNAVAGSGKTSTLQWLVGQMDFYQQKNTLLTAFNSHIKEELLRRQKANRLPRAVHISTIHGLGHKVLRERFAPSDLGRWVDQYKYERLTQAYWEDQDLPFEDLRSPAMHQTFDATAQLCDLAMLTLTDPADRAGLLGLVEQFGIVYPPDREDALLRSIPVILLWGRSGLSFADRHGKTYHPKETISFTDMIYLPLVLDLPVPQFDFVFVDETQDLNRAQQELLLRVKSPRGRAVWVGDRSQAIYAFMGADAQSFDRIREITEAKPLPLSICYRCARSVVELAQTFVPEIECSPDAPRGEVFRSTEDRLIEYVFRHAQSGSKKPFMLLCRVNAPLISVALQFLSRGVAVKVRGRDIGTGMNRLIDHLAELPGFLFSDFPDFAERYRRQMLGMLKSRKAQEQVIAVNDRVDSVLAIYSAAVSQGKRSVAEMKEFVTKLFSDADQTITLSSIHKAKGLEADRVGILRPDLLPHPKADTPSQLEQERNLCYVAITRAREELYIAGKLGFERATESDEADPGAEDERVEVAA